jgi:FkbM family methyltransferase
LLGNQIDTHGVKLSVDNPSILTHRKSQIFFHLYEKDEILAVQKYLQPDLPVIELGAGIGLLSCFINKRLDKPENHIVLEANPELLPTLKRNRRLNNCKFDIKQGALGYGSDLLSLHIAEFTGSSLYPASDNAIQVPGVSLELLMANSRFTTTSLIVDIEGGEVDLIENEISILQEKVKAFFFEMHLNWIGNSRMEAMEKTLDDAGFRFVEQFGKTYYFENQQLR